MQENWDVIVIGGGAAGLMTATRTAERGLRTLLIEKNTRLGIKILMSGGTRCNLTHHTDAKGIVRAFGQQGNFLKSALAAFGPSDLVNWVESEGVPTKVEETGKVFPQSNKAADVLRAFTDRLGRTSCQVQLATPVVSIQPIGDSWTVKTEQEAQTCRNLVIATGGKSYPGSGTTGDAYRWLTDLGHRIVPPRPALVPLLSSDRWIRELSGVTIPDVRIQVLESPAFTAKPVDCDARSPEARGSVLFTHLGLSGPAILDVSRGVTARLDDAPLGLVCDFLPDRTPDDLISDLRHWKSTSGKRPAHCLWQDWQPRRLTEALEQVASFPQGVRTAEVSRSAWQAMFDAFKSTRVAITGTAGFPKAEVTAGGVALNEVDSRNLQSKKHARLHLVGEVLDLDGPIGGFNFQAAFSTGWLAAERIPLT